MQRLQEAGLNPNLVYGEGVSGATGRAESIGRPERATFGNPLSEIGAFQNLKQSKAQTDLTTQAISTEFQKGILAAEQAAQTAGKSRLDNQTYNQKEALFKSSLQASRLNVEVMKHRILGQELENDFKSKTMQDRVANIYWQVENAKENVSGKRLSGQLLELQRQFLNLGS